MLKSRSSCYNDRCEQLIVIVERMPCSMNRHDTLQYTVRTSRQGSCIQRIANPCIMAKNYERNSKLGLLFSKLVVKLIKSK